MSQFNFYFLLGWEHIMSLDAIDHLLFLTALAASYSLREWKMALILVTAFTLGHSITLALSALNLVRISSALVEFLIPCTIAATALFNLFKSFSNKPIVINYILVLIFGFVHGLGFANTLRFLLVDGESFGWALFGFNVGLECGQLLVVIALLLISFLLIEKLNMKKKYLVITVSMLVLVFSIKMMVERWPIETTNSAEICYKKVSYTVA
jgi:hypothetical protein